MQAFFRREENDGEFDRKERGTATVSREAGTGHGRLTFSPGLCREPYVCAATNIRTRLDAEQ
ncbi:hypothetical protein BCAR13_300108 [Paraburkholderia caribensis]|jgi:hypothetical protein|nr:hypothetical protein BCAR13_300108 [Paraburkholderia caribensis]